MLVSLYNFFQNVIFYTSGGSENLANFFSRTIKLGDFTCTFKVYLCNLCSLISLIFIFILCCLFVYKIIKLIGGLIR